ncbi:MAG TPA: lysophospholipid acyltransferase family protein [Terriglobales bacterium]|nr:lysophospholipid acyltransferase family protein [Terriglobales bacterium]
MRHRLEYAVVWLLVCSLQALPRPLARAAGISLGYAVYLLHPRLRRVGMRNLEIAMPGLPKRQRRKIVRGVFVSLGRQLAEFCRFPKYSRENVGEVIIYDGVENFEAARSRGKGVLFLTAHLGGWEISSFMHSLHGHAMHIVARGLDNPYVDRLVTKYRTLHGNQIFDKDDYARGLLAAIRGGETIGILMDTNMTPPQGIFADFFGTPACTASGLARVALKTEAAVLPGFAIWDKNLRKYRLHMAPALELIRTGDSEADIAANTALFNRVLEDVVRKYPDQWLWVHRRWKTRPEGQPGLY